MRVAVSRTTSSEAQPCEEAYRAAYVRHDERNTDDPAKIPAKAGIDPQWWYAEGRNHRIENGHIIRDFDDEAWFMNLESLDDLLRFIAKYGDVVVGPWYSNESILKVEIYDDYRE
jgi:hypothetical protein